MHFIYHTHLTSSFHRYIWQDELKDFNEQFALEKKRRLGDPEQAAKDKNTAAKKDKKDKKSKDKDKEKGKKDKKSKGTKKDKSKDKKAKEKESLFDEDSA
jgi:hypothetical protein